ncbi:hypothetical protein VKT23_001451 [Stygiomarasmius scandens]|uniref:FAD-binding PCMH-type domain-containing protein n=1 Tax=Marasmiellus scandens TaxID=2682957 RepID=A0ABR1K130_9AGAR
MITSSSPRPPFLQHFQGDLIFPEDQSYPSAISRWASNAERRAAFVAFPKTTSDISLVLDYALRESNPALPVAVKCGGHSASGLSSVEGGVVVDLSRYFGDVKIDEDNKLAYVGGGALWATVDEKAMQYGLATVGGVVNHTGVGGLTLGGGFGYLTGEHGLTVDNLVQATITLASGQTFTISTKSNEHPDLFWGIRGAWSNFGVISEFVFRLHSQRRDVYSGVLVFPVDRVEEVCRVANLWWDKGPSEKERLTINMAWNESMSEVSIHNEIVLQIIPFYNGSEAEGREVFRAFLELDPVQDLTTSVSYEKLNTTFNTQFPHGKPYITTGFQTRHALADPKSIRKVVQLFERFQEEDTKLARPIRLDVVVIHEYTPWAKVLSVPDSETPFPRSRVNNGILMATWSENEEVMNDRAKKMVEEVKKLLSTGEERKHAQDSDGKQNSTMSVERDFRQSPAARLEDLFGPENHKRLKGLKRKYDSENVFCRWLGIEPNRS